MTILRERNVKQLIESKDYKGIEQALSNNPLLANEGLPYDDVNTIKCHPLHRICDGVFDGKYTDEEAVRIARIFLKYGANINGYELTEKQDTPLIAAASLQADHVAIFYIENGAFLNHAGCHGGTSLHWAAWCGRPGVVAKLVQAGSEINRKCIDFKATPLFWAVHGLKNGGTNCMQDTIACVRTLIQAGADKNIPNYNGDSVFDLLNAEDTGLRELLNGDK